MALCVLTASGILKIAATSFVLSWTHSVEKVPWEEYWAVADQRLVLDHARIKGSGAGMEPPDDAILRDGWYVYKPHIPPRDVIILAASGATVSSWSLCANDMCYNLGAEASTPIRITVCGGSALRSD